MRARMLATGGGIALAALIPLSPVPALRWLLVPLLPIMALLLFLRADRRWQNMVLLAGCLMAGTLWALARGGLHADKVLPLYMEGVDFWISGQVSSLPREFERYQQFDFRIEHSCFRLLPDDCEAESEHFRQRLVQLNVYDRNLDLKPGQRWRLRVRLSRPRGLANPAGMDAEARYFQQGISARGYVRETVFNELLDGRLRGIDGWRYQLRERLGENPLLRALVIGDRHGISDEQWQLFSATGTNHLVVISGLHVGFVAMLAYWLVSLLARCSCRLMLKVPAQQPAAVAAVVAALVYAKLAGFSLPTQRAVIMVSVFMCGRLLARRYPASLGLILALLLVLLLDPLSVTNAGFWLSFIAVAGLLLVFSGERRAAANGHDRSFWQRLWLRWWQGGMRPQWVVFVALMIPLAVLMGRVSLIAPLANVLAIPLVSLLAVPMALLAVVLMPLSSMLSDILLTGAAAVLDLLESLLTAIVSRSSEHAIVQFHGPQPVALLFAAVACLLLLLPRGWPGRFLALPLLLPLLLPRSQSGPEPGKADVMFLDVGQGLAITVQTHSHVLVFDTGPGSAVVGPWLRASGMTHIDRLIISHWHQDHAGGLEALMEEFTVTDHLAGSLDNTWRQFDRCQRGDHWIWDDVQFSVLHPDDTVFRNENDNSCVLRVTAGTQSLLLTGDMEAQAEQALLQHHDADELGAVIVQVPHHGSNSSSSAQLIAAVSPSVAVYSAGYRNRFQHPSESVLLRYQQAGSRIYGTPQSGAIAVRLGQGTEPGRVRQYRTDNPRYWRLP